MITLKRIYDLPNPNDGYRVLVERLWPRGMSKSRAQVDLWMKEIAPSPELRAWYSHDLEKWDEFKKRYRAELELNPAVDQLQQVLLLKVKVTFVFAARDEQHSSAWVLREYLEEHALA